MSLIYRAFHALGNLSTQKGQPTQAIYGIAVFLTKLLREEKPDYWAFAMDRPEPTFRHERFAGYKKGRPSMPDALASQLPWIRELLGAFKIPILEEPGYEADDILATVAKQAGEEHVEVALVTSDKDAMQLVNSNVKIYKPTREGYEWVGEKELAERWGVSADQVVEVMALMGDNTDAIPGIPGIGEKTAVELIQRFGSVADLLNRIDEVKGKARKETLLANKERLEMNRHLVTLQAGVPVKVDWEMLRVAAPSASALRRLYQQFEFQSLANSLKPEGSSKAKVSVLEGREAAGAMERVKESGSVAVVFAESGVGLSWEEWSGVCVPSSLKEKIFAALLESEASIICPNVKQAFVLLGGLGQESPRSWEDPVLASYLLDPARPSHSIEALSEQFLEETINEKEPLTAAGFEAAAALRLMPILRREMKERNLELLFTEVELPLARVLARMELAGIAVDLDELRSLSKQMEAALRSLTQEIYGLAGKEFNLNSPKQLAQILFEDLKLPVIKKTKTGASTDEEVLRRLSGAHELPAKLLEYREAFKLVSTYVEPLPKLVDPRTHRIHASFHQTVTATGRLSASNPNLQNIPIRTELGRQIRRSFVPGEKGWLFLSADYSQIELRILGHLSGDPGLLAVFAHNGDIHRMTAAQVFGVPAEEVTSDMRSAAKTINFGILYGMTPFGLSKELAISPAEAEEFIVQYFDKYPKVKEYIEATLEESRARGYCTTLLGRRRYLPELSSRDIVVRQFAERTAVNAPIQGSAADLIKIAMISVDAAIRKKKLSSRLLLQVHDELLFEVPKRELEEMRLLVKEKMSSPTLQGKPFTLSVPLEVNVGEGRNWLEAHA